MSSYSLILLVHFCLVFQNKFVSCDPYTFDPPNLKTVLFEKADLSFHCWSSYDVSLLLNRRVLQDLIPRKIPRDLPLLLKYLKSIEDIVDKVPAGVNNTIITMAVGDVLGGYLQAIVIPVANEAYYAGNVDYSTVAELHLMLSRWKWQLSTDGAAWSQECDMRKIPTKVATLDISLHDPQAACQELYVTPPPIVNQTDYYGSQSFIPESPRVAIPYLDNNAAPNAMALPLKKRNLYSLMDPQAAYILLKYYMLSMRCLSGNSNDVLAFNNYFHIWIMSKVVPRLHDRDRWYPAFGAVMRVVETIKQNGLTSSNPVFVQLPGDEHQDAALNANIDVNDGSKSSGKTTNYLHILNSPYAIMTISGILLAMLLMICCICVLCCWFGCRQTVKKSSTAFSDSNETVLKNAIISFFCETKNCLTNSGSKLGSDSSGKEVDNHKTLDYKKPISNPQNTPDTFTSDVSLAVTSDSEEDSSTSSKDES